VVLIEASPERITLANPQASSLLGWDIQPPLSLDEFLARNSRVGSDGAVLPSEMVPMVRSLRQGEMISRAEIQLTRPDASAVTLFVNSAPLTDDRGQITGAIVVFQDITQMKDAEQLKDEFLSLVSHELRTPLTTIQAGATMLLRDWEKLDSQIQHEILDDISREGRRLGNLVENMVQLAQIRAGRRQMETQPVHIDRLIRRTLKSEEQILSGRDISVAIEPDLIADMDSERIEQVVRNLLHNAVKYSPAKSPIEISACGEGHEVAIYVRDYGAGIDDTDLPFVFERFRRAASAESSGSPGMGLGLYLSRHVVEAHGGRIWIQKPEGVGTRVHFTVPRAAADDE
jgi:signal transduction histidine kinase